MGKTASPQNVRGSSPQPDRLSISERIEALRSLETGWNGYGAGPIDPGAIEAAKRFAAAIPGEVAEPQVVPMTWGRLQLEWHRGNRSLELEFETPTAVHYLKFDPDRGVEEEDILAADDTGRLIGLLDWFSAE